MSIVAVGMMTMTSNMNRDFKAFDEKVEIQGLQLQVRNMLSSPGFCKCFMRGNTFNYSTKSWNDPINSMGAAYDGTTCDPLGTPMVNIGTRIGNSNLLPASMQIENITETVVGSGSFSANLNIKLDQSLLTRSRKDISVPIYFTIKMSGPEPDTARLLNSCGSEKNASISSTPPTIVTGGAYYRGGPAIPSWTEGAQNLDCPPGSIMTGVKVNTSGTARHQADGDGPIIQSIHIKCTPIE